MDRTNLTKTDYDHLIKSFFRCLNANYKHIENDADYAIEESEDGKTLYLLFQWTHSQLDWFSNIDFIAKPYKDMKTTWWCHRGFLRVWKTIKPYVEPYVKNNKYEHIEVIGYSHGAAIATLAHEYVWFNRPDLRENGLIGFGFGCPRCYFGWHIKKELKQRWETFYPIRNLNDLVTHVPPVVFGFRHVSKLVKIGDKKYNKDPEHPHYPKSILAHFYTNYLLSMGYYDEEK